MMASSSSGLWCFLDLKLDEICTFDKECERETNGSHCEGAEGERTCKCKVDDYKRVEDTCYHIERE